MKTEQKVKVKCVVCGREEEVFPSRAKRYKTCSKECMGILSRGEANTTCLICGKVYHLKPRRIKRCDNKFCSVGCFAKWKSDNQKGADNPNFRNRQVDSDGYKIVYSGTYGRVKLHHAVVFDVLGINKIPTGHQIHHRDCDPLNNISDNLVMLNNSDHRWLHKQFGNATLQAYCRGKVDKETLCSWSDNKKRADILLDLTVIKQSAVLKLGEFGEKPEMVNTEPSL